MDIKQKLAAITFHERLVYNAKINCKVLSTSSHEDIGLTQF